MVTEIVPGLYMSDLSSAECPRTHTSLRITHVLSVMPGNVLLPKNADPALKTLQIPIRDGPFEELAAHLGKTGAFIAEALSARGRVLVHCVQGKSRSASVVAAYLMQGYGWSVGESVDFVRARCANAEPNPGFVSQLYEFHGSLHQKAGR